MTSFSTAIEGAYKAARAASGLSITYARPSTGNSVSITAVPGASVHSMAKEGEVMEVVHSRDYLILASDLVLGGSTTEPTRHDTITEGGVTYKVLDLDGQPQWRYTDHTKVVLRVHTKEV